MTRISWVFVACACFTVFGCGPKVIEAPRDEAKVMTTTPIEEDLKASGMEGMTHEEYLRGGKK